MTDPELHIYEFGDFRIEASKHLLLRMGKPVTLTPKVFDTLLYLVRRRGDLVEKDDLIRAIWPDTVVEEGTLRVHDEVLDLFIELEANEAQLDAPVIYASAREGVATLDMDRTPTDLAPLLAQVALAPMYMARAVLPLMREQRSGVILNMASDAAKVPTPGETIIGAAMAAIVMFSRTLALEAKRDGIRVNVLTPSLIAGTATAERVQKEGFSAKLFAKAASLAHLGVAEPDDLAALIVFLASPQARRITGQVISVNGGISAG